MKHLFLMLALCSAWLVSFSQQADTHAKDAVGQNRNAVTKATVQTPADKTGKNDVGSMHGQPRPVTPADTIGLSSQQKHIGK
ncbi:MAG TPA: hypothetical protein VK154_16430 [Chitinophagales bacterium]|nr:hypothetical protein [Chitinophagales bacterium]